jgi:transposase-like protein
LVFSLGSLFIPRFYCPKCHGTCSRLPACLSPRRQYGWGSQQAVLARLLSGASIREVAQWLWPSRRTIGRWWRHLEARFGEHALHLRSRFPELGRSVDGRRFGRCVLSA